PFRFLTAHPESIAAPIEIAQGLELLAGPLNTTLPVIVAADMNADAADFSDPTFVTYQNFLDAGFVDAWTAVNPFDPGFSCCQAPTVANPLPQLDERVDLITVRGPFRVQVAALFGEELGDRTSGALWPSDHAAVAARLLHLGQD
ncbi:MAG: endonuclease/exonuclease/phosphatase family protein, partial [Terriglobia bacterium]